MARDSEKKSAASAAREAAPDGVAGSESGGTRDTLPAFDAIPDWVRRLVAAGLSGFFLTEEAFRKALGDTLPKEWSDFAVAQSERTRRELLERLSAEIARTLENVDLANVLSRLLEGHTVEVEAKIRLAPDRPGAARGNEK